MADADAGRTPGPQDGHSLIGASSVSRLIACPASFGLAQQAPKHAGVGSGSSIYAATGTVAHALAEDAIATGYDPRTQLGETVTVDGHDVTVDEDMIEAVNVYVAEVKKLTAGATYFALETKVVLDPYWDSTPNTRPSVSAFGTADLIVYHAHTRHLDVGDYKNGAGVFVDVTDNPQLLYYGAGALLEIAARGFPAPLTVTLHVVQPRVRGAEKVRVFHTTALDVLVWVEDVLKPTITEAMSAGPRIAAGSHCRFCPARAVCPALAGIRQDLARRDFGANTQSPVVLADDELGRVILDADLVDVHVQALRAIAQDKLASGISVPHCALEPKRPVRSWDTTADELARLLPETSQHILFEPRTLRTPAALEKLLTPDEWARVRPFVRSKSSGLKLTVQANAAVGSRPADAAPPSPGRSSARDDFS